MLEGSRCLSLCPYTHSLMYAFLWMPLSHPISYHLLRILHKHLFVYGGLHKFPPVFCWLCPNLLKPFAVFMECMSKRIITCHMCFICVFQSVRFGTGLYNKISLVNYWPDFHHIKYEQSAKLCRYFGTLGTYFVTAAKPQNH